VSVPQGTEGTGLAGSRSPFLQHGAQQPVAWLPWGDEAFARARADDRPILLDIGAVWCHWCHVMDRESYEDEATAQTINDLYIPVKVDRDERPDVDARYQRAVQAISGQGGWPLTAFLTPDGEVFYGGTYFPPDERYGRPSFRRVLTEVARIWREEKERAVQSAQEVRGRMAAYAESESRPGEVTPRLVTDAVEQFAQSFDFRYGGFGGAPKFPNAGALMLILDHALDTGQEWARRIVAETLSAMARGGIYDQLGGGFHRYSTDARWLIPHFEKMAYDNGVLLEAYACGYAVLNAPLFLETARGIVAHYTDIAPQLVRAGGFPASQDADVGDDDGDYWTWTRAELGEVLSEDELVRLAMAHFGFDDAAGAMHLDPSRHVLFRALEADELAERLGGDVAEIEQRLAGIRAQMKAVRDTRARPYVDETLYTGWVALVAAGHFAAARYAGSVEAGSAALRALERIWLEAWQPGRGVLHRVGDAQSGILMEDQAHLLQALVDAFEYTQDETHLSRARMLVDVLRTRFQDADGAYRDRPHDEADAGTLMQESHRTIADAPSPAGNAVTAVALLRLSALTHESTYAADAHRLLAAFAGSAARMPTGTATFMRAVAWATLPVTTVVVVGSMDDAEANALFAAATRTYRPRTVVRRFEPDAIRAAELPEELRAMVSGEAPRVYSCTGQTCAAPMRAADELVRHLRGAGRNAANSAKSDN
jgi:uncharacterized protein YyaL (SSP411 family)